LIDACSTSRSNSRTSPQKKNEETLAGQSAKLRSELTGTLVLKMPRSFLCSGGFIPATLQRRESPVDLVDRKSLRIEVVTHPVPEFFMLLVLRIAYRLQQVVEAGYSATVFGRSMSFTR
jgi:hypothetical protein